MRAELRRRYRLQQFHPSWLGVWVNPFFLARRQLWREIAMSAGQIQGPMLDVGCGSKPYRVLFPIEYVGLEIDTEANRQRAVADAFYDGRSFPFEAGRFQGVLCNQVLEHVFNPDEFLAEVRRVLAPGGRMLLTVPFVWDEHEQPYDYARYSTFGLRALLERHGFEVISQRKTLADASLLFQLMNAYLFKVMPGGGPWLQLLRCVFIHAPVTLMGLLFGALLPKNPDLFLDQLVLAERRP